MTALYLQYTNNFRAMFVHNQNKNSHSIRQVEFTTFIFEYLQILTKSDLKNTDATVIKASCFESLRNRTQVFSRRGRVLTCFVYLKCKENFY